MSHKPDLYNILEYDHRNMLVINDFQQTGSLFDYLLIVSEKFDMGRREPTVYQIQ